MFFLQVEENNDVTTGFQGKMSATTVAALKCSYKRTVFRPYDGYKTEFLHHAPDIVFVHDVITDSESAILQELAMNEVPSRNCMHKWSLTHQWEARDCLCLAINSI